MRITGGIYRGRQITVPKGKCRPTQDMVRQAMFSMVGPMIEGARFLDMFGGSGAVGLEAASRGASSVSWIEADRRVFQVMKDNVEKLCGPAKGVSGGCSIRFYMSNALSFFEKGLENQKFNIIFADPPYKKSAEGGWTGRILDAILAAGALELGGLFIVEQSEREGLTEGAEGWDLVKDKVYGSSRLRFFAVKEAGGLRND